MLPQIWQTHGGIMHENKRKEKVGEMLSDLKKRTNGFYRIIKEDIREMKRIEDVVEKNTDAADTLRSCGKREEAAHLMAALGHAVRETAYGSGIGELSEDPFWRKNTKLQKTATIYMYAAAEMVHVSYSSLKEWDFLSASAWCAYAIDVMGSFPPSHTSINLWLELRENGKKIELEWDNTTLGCPDEKMHSGYMGRTMQPPSQKEKEGDEFRGQVTEKVRNTIRSALRIKKDDLVRIMVEEHYIEIVISEEAYGKLKNGGFINSRRDLLSRYLKKNVGIIPNISIPPR